MRAWVGRTAHNRDMRACDILDYRPKAQRRRCANILAMNPPVSNPTERSPRRFMLLLEPGEDVSSRAPRIRRYRLASVGRRSSVSEVDLATARIVRELGRMGAGR